MLALERAESIMRTLEKNGSAMVSELSEQLNVTEETIRRDLEKLEESKKIRRVHGGAYLFKSPELTVPDELRQLFFVEEKRRIAARCVEMINERDSIMLDCSTTALAIAQMLKDSEKKVTVVTNSFNIVQTLGSCDFVSVTCIGGVFKAETASFRGHMALSNLDNHFADKSFVSCTSLHMRFGATDHIESEAKIREAMLSHSEKRILIVDNTKFDMVSPYKISTLENLDYVVTDADMSEEWRAVLYDKGVQTVVGE